MKNLIKILPFIIATSVAAQVPSTEIQIKGAMLAAPEESKDSAMVYGYNDKMELVVLRKGMNEMVCLADDPNQKGFSAACYHRDLEPFMARGRELKAEGKSPKEIFDLREVEVKSGKLKMPKDGATLFIYFASDENYSPATGEVKNGSFRYVVYIPYATVESTGLPLKPGAPGMPWIMDPGTHRAHIMINPPKN
jgi:hypothetical protein